MDRTETLQQIAATRLSMAKLVNDLRRSVNILTVNIELLEAQTGVIDLKSCAYPVMARSLRARRDNLGRRSPRLKANCPRRPRTRDVTPL